MTKSFYILPLKIFDDTFKDKFYAVLVLHHTGNNCPISKLGCEVLLFFAKHI